MSDNLAQFNFDLERFLGKQLPEVAVAAQKKLALDALRGVVVKSPVDTGRFRGNWHLSTTPSDTVTGYVDKSPRGSPPKSGNTALATLTALQPYGVCYLQNALPYAQRLEDGWSQQAPGGMVALTVAELTAQIIDEVRP